MQQIAQHSEADSMKVSTIVHWEWSGGNAVNSPSIVIERTIELEGYLCLLLNPPSGVMFQARQSLLPNFMFLWPLPWLLTESIRCQLPIFETFVEIKTRCMKNMFPKSPLGRLEWRRGVNKTTVIEFENYNTFNMNSNFTRTFFKTHWKSFKDYNLKTFFLHIQ